MSSIFSGLESMGLKNLGDIKIYEEPEKEDKKKQVEVRKEPVCYQAQDSQGYLEPLKVLSVLLDSYQ